EAVETAEKNLRGLVPGKRVGDDQLTLVIRPQEAVAAVAALDQAYRDYYAAVGDHNRAQFRLYRALGHPAQCLSTVPTRPAPIPTALRRPITMMVLVAGVACAGLLAYERMKVDIFPPLDLPVIYVAQPYGGMDPQQMEGLIANYYEYHFLYINGIHHVESKNA